MFRHKQKQKQAKMKAAEQKKLREEEEEENKKAPVNRCFKSIERFNRITCLRLLS